MSHVGENIGLIFGYTNSNCFKYAGDQFLGKLAKTNFDGKTNMTQLPNLLHDYLESY
jgi:hypothetical protein